MGGDREQVERELEMVIRAIAEDEPVTLLTPPDLVGAARLCGFGPEVEIVPAPADDVWMRDIAPVFAKRGGDTVAIDFNFNGWDGSRSARPGDRLARTHDFGVPVVGVPFVGEGGALITDGAGVAVTTRSGLLSRNPHLDDAAITRTFGRIGMHTVIWLDGDRREPINFFVTRWSVLTARFGDELADPRAERQLNELIPGREIRLLDICHPARRRGHTLPDAAGAVL